MDSTGYGEELVWGDQLRAVHDLNCKLFGVMNVGFLPKLFWYA